MLSEKSPNRAREELGYAGGDWSPGGLLLWRILDEHHAAILALQGGQVTSAGGSDALEMLRDLYEWVSEGRLVQGAIAARLPPIIASLDSERLERAQEARSLGDMVRDAESALTAEQSLHNATRESSKQARESAIVAIAKRDDTITQLQRDLDERTRERDEALNNYRFMVEKAADQKLDGYRELGNRVAKAENERDELLRAVKAFAHNISNSHIRDRLLGVIGPHSTQTSEPGPDDGANCHHCGHYELNAAHARGYYAHCPSCDRHTTWVPARAKDAKEPTGETLIGPGARTGPILSRCDSPDCIAPAMHEVCNNGQHVAHFCDSHWLLLDAHLGNIAALVKTGCHPEIAAARVDAGTVDHGSNDDPLVILREMLHHGWDDDTLRELRSVIASLHNERIKRDAIASGLHRELEAAECERDAARRERDEAKSELLETVNRLGLVGGQGASIRGVATAAGAIRADRDRLQAELDSANVQLRSVAEAHCKAEDELATLRAQSSEGTLREAVSRLRDAWLIGGDNHAMTGMAAQRELSAILAAHPAPTPATETAPVRATASETASILCSACGDDTALSEDTVLHIRGRRLTVREWLALADAPPPTPGVAERIVERLEKAAGNSFNDPYRFAIRIVREEFAREPKQATAEIPGVAYGRSEHGHTMALIAGSAFERLELCELSNERAGQLGLVTPRQSSCFTRTQVAQTLIPLLSRFVATGKLTGGENG